MKYIFQKIAYDKETSNKKRSKDSFDRKFKIHAQNFVEIYPVGEMLC